MEIDTSANLEEWMCLGLAVVACMAICWAGAKAMDLASRWL